MKHLERRVAKVEELFAKRTPLCGVGILTEDGEEDLQRQINEYYAAGGLAPFIYFDERIPSSEEGLP